MFKAVKSKPTAVGLIFAFLLFYSPHFLKAQASSGNLIGFVYGKDGTTPMEGAVVKLRNVSSGALYESSKTDKLGVFKIEGINEGLYIAGVSLNEANFNVENILGIKAGQTAKISLSLKPQTEGQKVNKSGNLGKFFRSSAGIALLLVAAGLIVWGVYELTKEEASPFKK